LQFVQQISVRPEELKDLQAWMKNHPNVHVIKYDAAVREIAQKVAKHA
jgi:hypothetical protein